jgi:hypothetical protein
MLITRSQALALSFFTVLYNILEGTIAIFVSSTSGSNALFGFGLDSFIESLPRTVLIGVHSK